MLIDLAKQTPPEREWDALLDQLFPKFSVSGAAQVPYLYGPETIARMNAPENQAKAALAQQLRRARELLTQHAGEASNDSNS